MDNNIVDLPHSTKADLTEIISHIGIRLALIEDITGRLDRLINGNGKLGLTDNLLALTSRVKELEGCVADVSKLVSNHVIAGEQDAKEAKIRLAQETKDAKDLTAEEAKEAKDLLAKQVSEAKDMLAQEVETVREKKQEISGRMWTFIIGIALYVITNLLGLGFLILKSGFIK